MWKKCVLAAGLLCATAGCQILASASYWMPSFTSEQKSGSSGGPSSTLDLDGELRVDIGPGVFASEFVGQDGGQRFRVDMWAIDGEGDADLAAPGEWFADTNFQGPTNTDVNFEAIGVVWEPGFQRGDLRIGLAFGADLIRFRMQMQDAASTAIVELPDDDSPLADIGLAYIPVPLIGVNLEYGLKEFLVLVFRAEAFDTGQIKLIENVSAAFIRADIGVTFGKPTTRGVKGFLGYRLFHAEYTYASGGDEDSGDTTMEGLIATLGVRF